MLPTANVWSPFVTVMGPTQIKMLPEYVTPPEVIEAPELNVPYRAKEVRTEPVPLCMVIVRGKVTVSVPEQLMQPEDTISTLTTLRSLDEQASLPPTAQVKTDCLTVCAFAELDRNKVNKITKLISAL